MSVLLRKIKIKNEINNKHLKLNNKVLLFSKPTQKLTAVLFPGTCSIYIV